jgi:hypothetical protein
VAPRELSDAKDQLKSIRRIIRIEAHKLLHKDDPALLNLLEVIMAFNSEATTEECLAWAKDLSAVLNGVVEQVHETMQ